MNHAGTEALCRKASAHVTRTLWEYSTPSWPKMTGKRSAMRQRIPRRTQRRTGQKVLHHHHLEDAHQLPVSLRKRTIVLLDLREQLLLTGDIKSSYFVLEGPRSLRVFGENVYLQKRRNWRLLPLIFGPLKATPWQTKRAPHQSENPLTRTRNPEKVKPSKNPPIWEFCKRLVDIGIRLSSAGFIRLGYNILNMLVLNDFFIVSLTH